VGRVALGVVAAAGLGGVFAAGYVLADDTEDVDRLDRQVAALTDERDDLDRRVDAADSRADDAEQEADEANERADELEERLAAELDLKGEGEETQRALSSPPDADLRLGQAGEVGELIVKPTGFDRSGGGSGTSVYTVTITAKNTGSEPAGPFCGGAGVTLEDDQGRTFDGDSVIVGNTPNCGDDIQPGLTVSGYKMKFKLPAAARPALIHISDDYDESTRKSWSIE
jgi:outer membrane murein-binding lipoprotein Lpp